ncbi:DUF3558 domain-containing protein [Saccharopolyspora soli]|uniref:DUF3558 domain-containing protein n=1 Tax=Saccharopolyspora soli TaxID=2926618 RepID=UPI0027E06911|nr:DUF3558 domain-containing protein [Saccharopolyspora soli]
MLRRATLTAVSLLALVGAAACSPGGSTTPPSSSSDEPAASASAAPKVENPKNLKTITNACQLLTTDQLAQLGATGSQAPEQSTSQYGESQCHFQSEPFSAYVAINTKFGGLERLTQDASSSDNFKPTQVDGYQGARIDEQSDLCKVELAIADDQSVEINYFKNSGGTPEMDDPCGYAEKISSEVLKNIPDA